MKFALKLAALIVFMSVQEIIRAQTTLSLPKVIPSPNVTNQFLQTSNSPQFVLQPQSKNSQPLKPGVYQTYPYTCMVKVPAQEHDDCMVHGPAGTNSTMPISKPDLRFVPIPQKGK
jgi:hypothetical protein